MNPIENFRTFSGEEDKEIIPALERLKSLEGADQPVVLEFLSEEEMVAQHCQFGIKKNFGSAMFTYSGKRVSIDEGDINEFLKGECFYFGSNFSFDMMKIPGQSVWRKKETKNKKVEKATIFRSQSPDTIKKMIDMVDHKLFQKALSICFGKWMDDDYVQYFLETWAQNKCHLFSLFGDNLKLKYSTEYRCSPSMLDLLAMHKFVHDYPLYYLARKAYLSYTSLYDGKMSFSPEDDYFLEALGIEFDSSDDQDREFSSAEFIAKMLNIEYEEVESLLSQAGQLVATEISLSIDPFDILSMGFDITNLHIESPGQPKGNANISYMLDESTAVAFYPGKDVLFRSGNFEVEFPFKLWKQYIHINNFATAIFGKGRMGYDGSPIYKDQSAELVDSSRNFVENLISEYLNIKNEWDVYQTIEFYKPRHAMIYDERELVKPAPMTVISPAGIRPSVVNITNSYLCKCGKTVTYSAEYGFCGCKE